VMRPSTLCELCTVHLDGQASFGPVFAISQVGDGKITTIEGLSGKGNHPLQRCLDGSILLPQCWATARGGANS